MVGAVSPPVSTPEPLYHHGTFSLMTIWGEGVDTGSDTIKVGIDLISLHPLLK